MTETLANRPLTPGELVKFVRVAKCAITYGALLSEFETNFLATMIPAYARYGKKMRMSPDQNKVLDEIYGKLFPEGTLS